MFVVTKCGNLIVEPIRKMLTKPKLLFSCLLVLTLLSISAYAVPVNSRGAVRLVVPDNLTVINVVAQRTQSDLTTAYNALVEMTPTQDLTGQDLDGFTLTTASNSLVTAINGANVHLEAGSSAGTALIGKGSSIYEPPYRRDPGRPSGTVNITVHEPIAPIPEPTTIALLLFGAGILSRRLRTVR